MGNGYDMDELLGYEEMGFDDEELGYEEIGARRRPVRKKLLGPAAATMRSAGMQRLARKRVPLGLGSHTFAFAGATAHTFEVEPQRDFQGERLILDVTRSSSTVSEGVRVTSINIGDVEQMPAGEGFPASGFRPDATYAQVDFSTCKGGTKVRVTIELSDALESGETITVEAGIFGATVGQ